MFAYSLISGILFGIFFGFMALGLKLIFGVMVMVNLAHGDFVVLGGYVGITALNSWHINPLVSLIFALLLFFVVGLGLFFPLVPRLSHSRDPEMLSLILFFGLSHKKDTLIIYHKSTSTGPCTLPIPSPARHLCPSSL